MPCQTQHTRYLCSIFYLNVPSSSSEETLSVLKLHSTEAGTSSTLCTSAWNLNAHSLIYLWDRGRGKGVVKGQGWRECGAQRISIHPPLYYSNNATGDRARWRSITAMIPSTVHAPSVLNTSVDYYVSLLKLMTCAFQILELWGYLLTYIDFKKSKSVNCYPCCFTNVSVGYVSENTFCSQLRLFISRAER